VSAPVLQASVAAALAWYVAHDLLGHAQPFFAPIAAAVALSTSHVQRARRSVQMMVGVLLGIGVSELLRALIGDGAVPIGVVVFVTLTLAVAIGAGFVGEGMMFFNQAAASAVLVIALHKAGTGAERAVDALVGGGVALVIGVGLFPADPLKVLWGAENDLLRALLAIFERGRPPAREGDADGATGRGGGVRERADGAREHVDPALARADPEMGRALAASHEVHRRLTALTQARATARTSVRIAPRRIHMRATVEREERRAARMYLVAGGVLDLMRSAIDLDEQRAPDGTPGRAVPRNPLPPACAAEVDELAGALRTLLHAPRPWPAAVVEVLAAQMRDLRLRALPREPAAGAVVSSAAKRLAGDVIDLLADAQPAVRG
jgi:uncharacterized membrane protein YgaE (UPF0421/DUF939 family)